MLVTIKVSISLSCILIIVTSSSMISQLTLACQEKKALFFQCSSMEVQISSISAYKGRRAFVLQECSPISSLGSFWYTVSLQDNLSPDTGNPLVQDFLLRLLRPIKRFQVFLLFIKKGGSLIFNP